MFHSMQLKALAMLLGVGAYLTYQSVAGRESAMMDWPV